MPASGGEIESGKNFVHEPVGILGRFAFYALCFGESRKFASPARGMP